MIDVLCYGDGQDSQQVINCVDGVVNVKVGYRFIPASCRDDGRSVWGVRVYADSVDESGIKDTLESEFGNLSFVSDTK